MCGLGEHSCNCRKYAGFLIACQGGVALVFKARNGMEEMLRNQMRWMVCKRESIKEVGRYEMIFFQIGGAKCYASRMV